jgi:hypothetical protein
MHSGRRVEKETLKGGLQWNSASHRAGQLREAGLPRPERNVVYKGKRCMSTNFVLDKLCGLYSTIWEIIVISHTISRSSVVLCSIQVWFVRIQTLYKTNKPWGLVQFEMLLFNILNICVYRMFLQFTEIWCCRY